MRGSSWKLVVFVVVVHVLRAASVAATCAPPPAGLTAWWTGDGTTAEVVAGRNASLQNGAGYAPAKVVQGFALDGVDDYVDVAHDPALDVGSGNFSVTFWVKFTNTSGDQVLAEKYVASGTPTGWSLVKTAANKLRFTSAIGQAESGALPFLAGSWYQITLIRVNANQVAIVIGGTVVGGGLFSGDLSSPASFKLGHRGSPSDTPGSLDGSGMYLKGVIDEVMLNVGVPITSAEGAALVAGGGGSHGACLPTPPVCGSGRIDSGEICDDGNLTSGDGCDANCTLTACGNGIATAGEGCDDGNLASGDGCDSNCTPTACGNGILTTGEVCDDGNLVGSDGCEADCTFSNGPCAMPPSGVVGWWRGDGSSIDSWNGHPAALHGGAAFGSGVIGQAFQFDGIDDFASIPHATELNPGTGDFAVSLWVNFDDITGEQVLFEKAVASVGGWSLTKSAGHLIHFEGAGPTIEAAGPVSTGTWLHVVARRLGTAKSIFINGVDRVDGPGLADANSTASLKIGHRGDPSDTPGSDDTRGLFLHGRIDDVVYFVGGAPSDAEIQGMYAAAAGGLCNPPVPVCGNGYLDAGEACDDGNLVDGDGCQSDCTSLCGDAVRGRDEVCEDGNVASGDGCDSNCTPTACGNGVASVGEACDDGNAVEGDGCDSNCTLSACGNGMTAGGEQCDDGNLDDGDGCDSNCTITACGNGVASAGEACDDGNAVEGDGCDSNCTPTGCGNGIASPGEACDDGNGDVHDACLPTCLPNVCGDGILDPGAEQCDDGNVASGDGCDANCAPTGCGNGVVSAGEECDDGNSTNNDGCDRNCTPTACGNDVRTDGEHCDDGNLEDGDGCESTCELSPGILDPTFDGDGVAVPAGIDYELYRARRNPSVGILPDGRIVASYTDDALSQFSMFALAGFMPDGSSDGGFGTGGMVFTPIGTTGDAIARSMIVQPDGKIVVAGESHDGTAVKATVVRYRDDGSLDPTFGTGGIVVLGAPSGDSLANDVALDATGAILLAGQTGLDGGNLLLARLHPDGSLDATFGSGGVVVDPSLPPMISLAVLSDRSVIAAGSNGEDLVIARRTSGGAIDTSFGSGGSKWVLHGAYQMALVAVQADGKFVVAADYPYAGGRRTIGTLRLNADGSFDSTYDSDGVAVADVTPGDDTPRGLVIEADGGILVSGYAENNWGASEMELVRFRNDGGLDSEFNGRGWAVTALGPSNDEGGALALQPDGKILVAANTGNAGGPANRLVVLRYLLGTCGDRRTRLASGEQCDDGNAIDGDGCESDCTRTPVVETAPAGGTVTSDPLGQGATSEAPVQTAVTTPSGGEVTIAPSSVDPPAAESGVVVLGLQLHIEAPPATVDIPLVIALTLDASLVPPGVGASQVTVMRDGAAMPDCSGPAGKASPDPCVSSRTVDGQGDVHLTVLTSHASLWAFAVRSLDGGEQACVNVIGKTASAVAKAQSKVNDSCLKTGSRVANFDLGACVLAGSAKVDTARDKLIAAATDACDPPPPFGFETAHAAGDGAQGAAQALVHDVLGAAPSAATDKAGAACQAGILKSLQKVLDTDAKIVAACGSAGMKSDTDPIISRDDLAACLAAPVADVQGKVGKAVAKVAKVVAGKCAGLVPTMLTGGCGGADDPVACLGTRAMCRTCTMFRAAQGLEVNCDQVDNRIVDESCQ